MRRPPLVPSAWLSALAGHEVLLKLECQQPTGSYKVRGAFNALLNMATARTRGARVVTASAGNHGKALALAARACGAHVIAFVPRAAPRIKVEAMRALGAEVRECDDYDAAEREARQCASKDGLPFVSPYADLDVIAGAGTVALEILADRPEVATIVVALGGGGLAAGTGCVAHGLGGHTRVVAAEVEASSPFSTSLAAGRIVRIEVRPTLADGLAGNLDPQTPTFQLVQRLVDRVVVVAEPDLHDAVGSLHRHDGLTIEGAAAAAVAAVTRGHVSREGPTAIVVSGGNIDATVLDDVLRGQLKY